MYLKSHHRFRGSGASSV
jgi:hypothetical protein